MIRILHAADFHLDSAFASLPPELASKRRREQRRILQGLSRLCEDCDLVFLSGDLFDSARIYRDTLDALKSFFASVRVPVFIAPGNHDFISEGSPYRTEDWGENVHIFNSPEISCVHLPFCDVYGAAFTAPESPALLRDFRAEDPDAVNLMLLHGELKPDSVYNPMTAEEIEASGLSYLALGHIHLRGEKQCGKTLCAWPGCLMGRGFDECGEKGVLEVTVSERGAKTKFLPVPSRKYEILTVPVGDDALSSIRAALPEQTEEDCYRILLTGEAEAIDTAELEAALRDRFYFLSVRDRTVPKQALWDAVGEDTLRGHFLTELKTRYDGTEDETQRRKLTQAARLVTALMDGREVAP